MAQKELSVEERVEGFKKEYAAIRDKWQIDFGASVQPVMQIVDTKPKEEKVKFEEVVK